MVIISFSSSVNINFASYLITAIVAFIMCIQAKQKLLLFVPGTFIGACATFASNGDWRTVSLSLSLGIIIGFLMKKTGTWLHEKLA